MSLTSPSGGSLSGYVEIPSLGEQIVYVHIWIKRVARE